MYEQIMLDCTFRDGGFYTNWSFEDEGLDEYLDALKACGIKNVEIGLRNKPLGSSVTDRGSFYQVDEVILKKVCHPKLNIGLMTDVKAISPYQEASSAEEAFNSFYPDHCSISFVRFAGQFDDLEKMLALGKVAKGVGLYCCLNFMRAEALSPEQIAVIASKAGDSQICDTVYFADTFGNMLPEEVGALARLWKSLTSHPVGFHAHNNRGVAFFNSVKFLESGGDIIDGTVSGMGRGAGNAEIERILMELDFYFEPLLLLSEKYFVPLKRQKGWGHSVYYELAAINGIHPTYVQSLLADRRYSSETVLKFILDEKNSPETLSFDPALISELCVPVFSQHLPEILVSKLYEIGNGSKELMFAGGKASSWQSKQHLLSFNFVPSLQEDYTEQSLVFYADLKRLLFDSEQYDLSHLTLVVPRLFEPFLPNHLSFLFVDYNVSQGSYGSALLEGPLLSLAFGLSVVRNSGYDKIILKGCPLDFEDEDQRQQHIKVIDDMTSAGLTIESLD